MKRIFISSLLAVSSLFCFAETRHVTLNIKDIKSLEGQIKISISNNAKDFKNHAAFKSETLTPSSESENIVFELEDGEYAISIYQDTNGNGQLDTKKFGIPKEPFGFSNYDGKGYPGKFDKHKFNVQGDMTITVPLIKF